jgi:hypothetical protein
LYSHQKDIIEKAKKTKEAKQADKNKEEDKGKGKGGKDRYKKRGKGKGKGKICPYFNDRGCNFGSASKMLHEAPAMAAKTNQASANSSQVNPAPEANAAAAPKAAAADQAKLDKHGRRRTPTQSPLPQLNRARITAKLQTRKPWTKIL